MSSVPFKRRHVFINKAFQTCFIAGVLLLILLSGLCSALLIFWITGSDLAAQSQTAHASIANAWDRLGLSIFIGNAVSIIIAGTIAMFVVLFATHKIVGPMYRFEKLCEQVGEGNLEAPVALREKDQLQALGLAFADMVNQLRIRKLWRQECVKSSIHQLEQLKSDQTLAPHQRHLLEQLELTVKQLVE